MSDNMNLSQDELGALLGDDVEMTSESQGNTLDTLTIESSSSDSANKFRGLIEQAVAPVQKEFSQLLSEEVELSLVSVEEVKGINVEGASESFYAEGEFFSNGDSARHAFLFPSELSQHLIGKYAGLEDMGTDEEAIKMPLGEIVQKIIDVFLSVFGNNIEGKIGEVSKVTSTDSLMADEALLKVEWKLGDNSYYEFFAIPNILQVLLHDSDNSESTEYAPPEESSTADAGTDTGANSLFGLGSDDSSEMSLGAALLGEQTVSDAAMPSFDGSETSSATNSGAASSPMHMLMDVSMLVTVELGSARKTIGEILDLNRGSIIELKKLAGEPLDIKINQKLIARGEVVVIDEYFGVRIIEVVNPTMKEGKGD